MPKLERPAIINLKNTIMRTLLLFMTIILIVGCNNEQSIQEDENVNQTSSVHKRNKRRQHM